MKWGCRKRCLAYSFILGRVKSCLNWKSKMPNLKNYCITKVGLVFWFPNIYYQTCSGKKLVCCLVAAILFYQDQTRHAENSIVEDTLIHVIAYDGRVQSQKEEKRNLLIYACQSQSCWDFKHWVGWSIRRHFSELENYEIMWTSVSMYVVCMYSTEAVS